VLVVCTVDIELKSNRAARLKAQWPLFYTNLGPYEGMVAVVVPIIAVP
jgi:hypothetical protein